MIKIIDGVPIPNKFPIKVKLRQVNSFGRKIKVNNILLSSSFYTKIDTFSMWQNLKSVRSQIEIEEINE